MVPFIHSTTYAIFGLHLQTWGTLVAIGYAVGTWIAYDRAKRRGLDPERVLHFSFWIFLWAFLGARLVHVFLYEPGYFLQHPWEALDPRQTGWSMFGGLIGAAVAFFWSMRHQAWLETLTYADTLVWGLPWGCGIGRIGCFLIHDHPGTLTHGILGVRYPDGLVRHDLGLYLSLVGFATGLLFLFFNRHCRAPGWYFGCYLVIEGFMRFYLDFLRIADTRYAGLTPTQYLSVPLIVAGAWILHRGRRMVSSSR